MLPAAMSVLVLVAAIAQSRHWPSAVSLVLACDGCCILLYIVLCCLIECHLLMLSLLHMTRLTRARDNQRNCDTLCRGSVTDINECVEDHVAMVRRGCVTFLQHSNSHRTDLPHICMPASTSGSCGKPIRGFVTAMIAVLHNLCRSALRLPPRGWFMQ